MRIGFLFKNEAKMLLKEFKKRKDLDIKILASQTCYIDNEEFNIVKFFKENEINVQKADIPFVKLVIADSKEMMHTYSKFTQETRDVIPETAIGIWNQYDDIARNYNERFENQFKKISKKAKNQKKK